MYVTNLISSPTSAEDFRTTFPSEVVRAVSVDFEKRSGDARIVRPMEMNARTIPDRARSSRSEGVSVFFGRTSGTKKGLLLWPSGRWSDGRNVSGM